MNIKNITLILAACFSGLGFSANTAKSAFINVNPEITTLVVMPENIKMVDISSPFLVGNQCADNIVRIKPSAYADSVGRHFRQGEQIASITIVGERHIVQYDVAYASVASNATTIHHVPYQEMTPYINPDVAMPVSEMARLSWAVYASKRHFNDITRRSNGMKAVVNNIYSVGNYFFIDYSLTNETKIPYKIEETLVKLTDKKTSKGANYQTLQITPCFSLMSGKQFKKNYRNIIVIEKLTFPEEKVLKIEISENQISGRVIELAIDYKDILNADTFGDDVLRRIPEYRTASYYSNY